MQANSEGEILAFLGSEFGSGNGSDIAKTIHTHISTVVLIGERALKLKRAVHLPYLDLSTPKRRLLICERELCLNRRTAPQLYRAVHRITREDDGQLTLNGRGALIDAVLEMGRFDDEATFDRLAIDGKLRPADMAELAKSIAALHATSEISPDLAGAARMRRVLEINERAFAATAVFTGHEIDMVNDTCRMALARQAALLDERARTGRVRRCHGDLHLRNIALVGGKPLVFDCLEFDEDLATTDVLYDLAFVLMDLWRHGLRELANVLFNRYLDETGDEAGMELLPFFMAVRAAVRAHVTASEVSATVLGSAWQQAEAKAYLELCRDLLMDRPAALVAIGGFSGSGKSTVAAQVAPGLGSAPGARVIASDRIRKWMFGVCPETRLTEEAYSGEASERVYLRLCDAVHASLLQGYAAIADAVFDREGERARVAAVAIACGVPFQGVWLEAAPDVLVKRVSDRCGDVSDATGDIVAAQLARGGVPADWPRIWADTAPIDVANAVRSLIERGVRLAPSPRGAEKRSKAAASLRIPNRVFRPEV